MLCKVGIAATTGSCSESNVPMDSSDFPLVWWLVELCLQSRIKSCVFTRFKFLKLCPAVTLIIVIPFLLRTGVYDDHLLDLFACTFKFQYCSFALQTFLQRSQVCHSVDNWNVFSMK